MVAVDRADRADRADLLEKIGAICSTDDLEALLATLQAAPPSSYALPSPLTDESTEAEAAAFQEAWIRHTVRVARGDIEALLAEYQQALAQYRERVANRALTKREPFDPLDLAYSRGFWAGCAHVLISSPARAKALLEQGAINDTDPRPPAWRES